ncbi:MFS transporter [Streptomyces chartreusis]|uniref:MFS transporter n=1 Tax=Streptomyces chartreusis TaxID=1969 RepID=A0A7H8T617_STRCX|nr:MFS transporter [Streptomyces chartreusis]QKZ17320.1 MFS transporter [Streptomyces chartreusis]
MNRPSPAATSLSELSPSARRRSVTAVIAGTAVEYFDWIAYASFAVYFAPQIFPADTQTASLLQSAAIFAVGFFFRPLGSIFFGKLADRRGRRDALVLSITLMTVGTLLIAVTPTYAQAGALAPALLLVARVLQGLALGGEYGPLAASLREIAPANRRTLYSSAYMSANVIGQVFGFLLLLLLNAVLSKEQMAAFGWRVPFVLAALGAVAVGVLRRKMSEGPEFTATVTAASTGPRGSLRELFTTNRTGTLLAMTIIGMGTVSFYTYAVYMQKLAVNSFGAKIPEASTIATVSLLVMGIAQPLLGMLGDRVGATTVSAIGFAGCVVVAVPGYLLMSTSPSFSVLLLTACVLVIFPAMGIATSQVIVTGLFPARLRALGAGFASAATIAVFGGTLEYVALSFKQADLEILHFVYLTVTSAIGLLAVLAVRKRNWPSGTRLGSTETSQKEKTAEGGSDRAPTPTAGPAITERG